MIKVKSGFRAITNTNEERNSCPFSVGFPPNLLCLFANTDEGKEMKGTDWALN
jgi:hypothetical protein